MTYVAQAHVAFGDMWTAASENQSLDNDAYFKGMVNSQIQIPGVSFQPTISFGCTAAAKVETYAAAYVDFVAPAFAYNTSNFSFFQLPALPSDYNGGTMTAHFIWTANDATANSVRWFVRGYAYASGNSLAGLAPGGDQGVTQANNSSAWSLMITSETPAITWPGTPTPGKSLYLMVYRTTGDSLAVAAYLLGVVLTYTRT
jgi:hypothetical protein